MKIICDTCGAKYSIADEKVRGKVFKIRCKKCKEIIVVRGTVEEAAAPAAQEAPPPSDYGGYDPATAAIWHVVLDGEQQGPYTAEQVAQFVAAGQLDYEAYCWRDGFADWIHLQDIEELYSVVAAQLGGASQPAQQPYTDDQATVAGDPAAMNYGMDPEAQARAQDFGGEYGQQPAADPGYGASAEASSGMGGFTAPAEAQAPASAQQAMSDLFGEPAAPAADPAPASAPGVAAASFGAAAEAEAARGAGHDVGVDLFANTDDGGGVPGSPSEQVVSSSPRVDARAMTGTRNENSVLFSLSNLQALASGSKGDSGGTSKSSKAGPAPGHAAGEGSGLIDIRAMAAAASTESDSSSGVDDLLAIGGGGGFAPTLGAPVLMAQPQERSNKLVFALVGVGAAILIGIGVLVAVLLLGDSDDDGGDAVAAAQQPAVLAPTVPAAAAPGTPAVPATAPAATGVQPAAVAPAASGPAPTPVPDESDSAGSGDEDQGSSGGSNRRRGAKRARSGGGGGGGGGGSSSAPAKVRSASDSPSGGGGSGGASKRGGSAGGLDALLDGALGGGGSSGGRSKRPSSGSGGGSSGGGSSSLPERLSRSQVQAGMNRVAGAVRRCGRGQSGTVMVSVSISGATGRVTSANVSGQFAGTPVGSCAARAVRGARFPRFRQNSLSVRYPFRVQ